MASSDKQETPRRKGASSDDGWTSWVPALLAVLFIRLFLFEPFRIPSGSMIPTLLVGDFVIVTKYSYGLWLPFKSIGIPFTDIGLTLDNVELIDWGNPDRGDVIVFHYPQDENLTYIKRVIGLPGDTVEVRDNRVILNGEPLPHTANGTFTARGEDCKPDEERRWKTEIPREHAQPLTYPILTEIGYPGTLANHAPIKVPPNTVFAMGDNRDHSADSRAWGFVRYDQIKGKAQLTWLSWEGCLSSPGSFRTERIFRSLYSDVRKPNR